MLVTMKEILDRASAGNYGVPAPNVGGEREARAAIEAAEVVFMTSSAAAIPEAVEIARATGKIALQNIVFALSIKAIVVILGLAGLASMWMAVFADSGVAMLCVVNSIRLLYRKQ